ncbi:DUF4153 domain-containing protein [Halobacillus sp. BBL2006]|uniref:DUF4153 domain-containing protein n=1 Tax=Halobacillus sp. BBL2006 TaxID=1543706 RepID=UPI000541ADB5|nr:DUF4173 domain-containing protein [Halobacillus sp. BBL2006]KHE73228.1 hypothetical protein LD39_00370 [Halobacillus sp. BBL2006]
MHPLISGKDLLFLTICLVLGVLAELSFFHTPIGVSFLVFLVGFYTIFFIRFRHFQFRKRRMGMLLMGVIWVLAAQYTLYDNALFQALNILVIPTLVVAHIVLITKPTSIRWHTPMFIKRMVHTVFESITYNAAFTKAIYNRLFKGVDENKSDVIKKLMLGLLIGVPLIIFIVGLLMQADQAFQELLGDIPSWFMNMNINEFFIRAILSIMLGMLFFGVFQILPRERGQKEESSRETKKSKYDGIVSIPVLILLNLVYFVFTIVQFTYFFGGELQGGMSYAEYARRGFFELLLVTLVNLTTLVLMLSLNKPQSRVIKVVLKSMYSLLIVFSGVLLVSAFQRLTLYEQQYGYTMDRVLPHVFMVFLFVIFTYTLIKVWVEQLPLIHFYILTGLLFYTGLNAINVEKWTVQQNLERFEETEKIDVYYLSSLSYTGVDGLLNLYEKAPEYPNLEEVLKERKQRLLSSPINQWNSWQSFNIQKYKVLERLEEWETK